MRRETRSAAADDSIPVSHLLLGLGLVVVGLTLWLWWRQGSANGDRQHEAGAGEERTVTQQPARIAERRKVEVIRELPHDPRAFTQGLLWWDGSLWESTGTYGGSEVRRLDPANGDVLQRVALDRHHFGEGLARIGETLYQLTWKEGVALRWKLPELTPLESLYYEGEGWGLCFDGEHLVWSDGTDLLRFVDPEDFSVVRRLDVTLDGKPMRHLNELECVGDRVWANVWTTSFLARIDPETGEVDLFVDASGLLTREERLQTDVFNGIAHHPESGHFYVTGKNWPKMFVVQLTEDVRLTEEFAEEMPEDIPNEIQ